MSAVPNVAAVRRDLMSWYDANARALPWRVSPSQRLSGAEPDPYRVWLSEIMLQQTTTSHAAPFFLKFTTQWPTIDALASAEDDAVMAAWAGLGYYARARNLLACARVISRELSGFFPAEEEQLRALPGIGAYTAAAVAAIAFNRPATVVDANVERVVSRLYAVEQPLPASKPILNALAAGLVHPRRPGDWAQATMDLGATVCGPKDPKCANCPIAGSCRAHRLGVQGRLPAKMPKPERPKRRGSAFVVVVNGEVALVRRAPKGLLGGMLALPSTVWAKEGDAQDDVSARPQGGSMRRIGSVEHVFTHFVLSLDIWVARDPPDVEETIIWTPVEDAMRSMPTLFKKALSIALAEDRTGSSSLAAAAPKKRHG